MKLSVAKLMHWVVIVMLVLSVNAPAMTVAGHAPVVTDMTTAEPESNAQHILIKVQPSVDAPIGRLVYASPTALARALMAQGVTTAQTLFHARPGTSSAIGLERIYRLELTADADMNKAVAALGTDPDIEWAEPDYIAHAISIPDDPLYTEQWGLSKINAPDAWDIVTGTQTVVIAVVDSGIDLTHPDLQANLWANPGEIPGNGIDDDNNGYVDDVRGWNFVNGTNNVYDGNGHGTQVAGVAAAVTDNALGIAGVCWNCKIMPVRVMADSGISNYSDIALGIRYAADKGAKVINLSLGGYSYSNALRDAIDYAVNEKGAVVVGGAGNDNVSTLFYPAAYDNVLAVAGTTADDTKAAFSDYGTWVDISAPAVEITTTYLGGDWGPANGTSLAAPFVAGMAALIRSQRPDWSAALVRNQLLQTADNTDALDPAYAGKLGAGRINAAQATQDPYPIITLVDTTVNGDPLGRPTPGEAATLVVTLRNDWWDATGVTGTLTTADPYVTLGQATAEYGDLASGASSTSSPVYTFTVAAGAGYNHPIPFTLSVSANDGAYTTVIPFTITTRSGDEHFCGTVAEDMVWTNDKTYILDCNVGIAPGYTLTIQAGTEVHFSGDYSLNVGGALIADGTAAQPIRFMPHTGGSWGRIFFDDPSADAQATSDGVYQSGNLLRHVRIEGAVQGIGCTNATPFLEYVTLASGGMNCTGGDTSLWVKNNDLSGDTIVASIDSLLGVFEGGFGDFTSVVVSNGYAYVAENEYDYSVLYVVDVSDPQTPLGVGLYDPPDNIIDIDIATNYIYAANYSGLRVVDISDPTNPTEVSFYNTPGQAMGVTIFDRYAYVADGESGLRVVDVIDPTYPVEIGFYDTPGYAHSVAVLGEYAYVADSDAGLRVVNIADPTHPIEVGSYDTPDYASDVVILGEYAYVADRNAGIRIVNIAIPTNPVEVGFYDTPGDARRVTVSSGYAYVADSGSGLRVVDVTDPTNPIEVGSYDTPSPASDIVILQGYMYAASSYSGLRIYRAYSWKNTSVLESVLHGGLSLPDISQVLNSTVDGNITVGSGSVIQNTAARGGISINGNGRVADSTAGGININGDGARITNNSVIGGSIYASNKAQVNKNTVSTFECFLGIQVGAFSIVRDNKVHSPGFCPDAYGIRATNQSTVTFNTVSGFDTGIKIDSGWVIGNLIYGNLQGIEIGSTVVKNNTFTGNVGSAIKITSGTPGMIVGNNFEFNTGTYDVENLIPKDTVMTVDARNNWWGTTNGTLIRQRIWDFNDDYSLGTVLYAPTLTAPDATAPAYVRAVTLTPESPVGIQTVMFDVIFSREMDTGHRPAVKFYTIQNDSWQTYTTSDSELSNNQVWAIAVDQASNKWFGTSDGLSVLHADATWETYTNTNSGLTNNDIRSIAVDMSGSKWLGTWGGVSVLRMDGSWQTYDTSNSGLVGNVVLAIAEDQARNKWFGTYGSGVSVLRSDNSWQTYTTANSGLANNDIHALAADLAGNIYFGTWGSGMSVLRSNGTWQTYNTANSGLIDNTIPAITVDSMGNIWIGTEAGVSVLGTDGTWQTYNTSNSGIGGGRIHAIAIDSMHNKWFAPYGGGISVLRADNSWQTYMASTEGLANNEVFAIGIDTTGNRWFGTYGGGVSVLMGGVESLILENPQWPAPNLYRASYDFSTLIPRGVYSITVQGAQTPESIEVDSIILPLPGGGMEIAPNSAYTFTVDYAGYINDTTAPPAPVVTACAAATPDTLSAIWSAYDPESAIDRYQYAIGAAPNSAEVVNWTVTPLTETTRVSLTLVSGQTYYFSIKARNEGGIWSEAGSVGIVAGSNTCVGTEPASLEVDFSGTPRSGDAPLEVQFTSIVTGTVTDYAWFFGDGGVASIPNPMHTYQSAGSFGVTVVVTGPGRTVQVVKPAYITVNPPSGVPTATFSADVVSGTVPLAVNFTAVTSGTVEGWLWTFGDGGEALAGPIVQHTYQAPGVFDVSLTVSNTHGSYTVNKPDYITVTEPPIPAPEVDFTGTPSSGDAPLDVHFTSIVTGEVTSYAWSFGDGGVATTANPTHTYTSAGSFSVSLVVTGPGGTAQAVKPGYITANPPPGAPTVAFSADVISGTVPLNVTFTAVTSGTVEGWRWTFGDSTVAFTGPVVQHTYQTLGTFDVSLTVSNTYGSYTVNKLGYITVSSGGHSIYLPLVLRN